jgi:hypothetical protein
MKWKDTLTKRKQSASGKKFNTLPKDQFPSLLKKVLDDMAQNLISAFRKAGVVPINKQEIMSRMPRQDRDVNLNVVGDVFLTHLTEKRQEFVGPRKNAKRKNLNVPPGGSICQGDIQQSETSAPRTEKQLARKEKACKTSCYTQFDIRRR